MIELSQEQFEIKKELAEIQAQISRARGTFQLLEQQKEEWLKEREIEANKRITKLFEESVEALNNVSKNHHELELLTREITDYAVQIETFYKRTLEKAEALKEYEIRLKEDLDFKEHQLSIEKNKVKMLSDSLIKKRENLEQQMLDLQKKTEQVESQRLALKYAFDELEEKQKKQFIIKQ